MTRGRPRPRKPRLTRMDAAIDCMAKYGFPEEIVQSKVKELLGEYGGNEGWPFIEDDQYGVLLDALLRDGEDGNQSKGKSMEDGRDVGTSLDTHQNDQRHENSMAVDIASIAEPAVFPSSSGISNGDNEGWKDINVEDEEQNKTVRENHGYPMVTELHTTPATPALTSMETSSRRRFPCYGWIESDEDEDVDDDFMHLQPASQVVGTSLYREISKPKRIRKSRWDEKP